MTDCKFSCTNETVNVSGEMCLHFHSNWRSENWCHYFEKRGTKTPHVRDFIIISTRLMKTHIFLLLNVFDPIARVESIYKSRFDA